MEGVYSTPVTPPLVVTSMRPPSCHLHTLKMSTGVAGCTLDLEVVAKHEELRSKKLKYVIHVLNGDKSELAVDRTSDTNNWGTFLQSFPVNDCRCAVYNFEYEGDDGSTQTRILFFIWIPHDASKRNKSMYNESIPNLRTMLEGVDVEIPATNLSEMTYDVVLKRVKRL